MSRYYRICRDHIGSVVRIRTYGGSVYEGEIEGVSRSHVYLRERGRPISSEGKPLGQTADGEEPGAKGTEVQFFRRRLIIPLAAIFALTVIGLAARRRRRRFFF